MDLIATVSVRNAVDVWRLNGQRVFGKEFDDSDSDDEGEGKGSPKVVVNALAWKRDGTVLAVGKSDGEISLIDAFSGKVVHRLERRSTPEAQGSFSSSQRSRVDEPTGDYNMSSLAWSMHFASPDVLRHQLDEAAPTVVLDHILGLKADIAKLLSVKADLPRELAGLDVESSLPKLSTLPPTGGDDDVFSARSSIDSIFHTQQGRGDVVDALVAGFGDAKLHIRIFDSFEIGDVDVGRALPGGVAGGSVFKSASHPFLPTAFLLVEGHQTGRRGSTQERSSPSLHLLSLDFSFIAQTGYNLPLLARKATQLANLLRYLSQIVRQLGQEVKAAFDLPARFLRNVNETLAEQDEDMDFVTAAHHLAVTGECHGSVREWLVDEVQERGLKRWEKAVADCLDVVRRLVSECLLPGLEKCQVALSRLDGLARYGQTSAKLGLNEQSIKGLRDTVDVLSIVGEDILQDVCAETREFEAFMRWMKWEAEVEALEEGSERAEELRESWIGEGELKTVLEYVGGAMQESRLKKYVLEAGAQSETQGQVDDAAFYTSFRRTRTSSTASKTPPTLGQLIERLKSQSEDVFSQIAETLRKSILARYMLELPPECNREDVDVRVVPDATDQSVFHIFLISKSTRQSDSVWSMVVSIRHQTSKGSKLATRPGFLSAIDGAEEVLDVKFVDDETILVLVSTTAGDTRILSRRVSDGEDGEWELRRVFEGGRMDAGMKPAKVDVNGNVGRRVVAVVDRDGAGYTVLDLDADGGPHLDDQDSKGDESMTG